MVNYLYNPWPNDNHEKSGVKSTTLAPLYVFFVFLGGYVRSFIVHEFVKNQKHPPLFRILFSALRGKLIVILCKELKIPSMSHENAENDPGSYGYIFSTYNWPKEVTWPSGDGGMSWRGVQEFESRCRWKWFLSNE